MRTGYIMARSNGDTYHSCDEWRASPVGTYVDRRRKKLITDLLDLREDEQLLDVGCKTGHLLLYFRRLGCDVTGVESSKDMLAAARERLGERADLRLGTPEDLPFSDNEFDIVTVSCFESTRSPAITLSEAIRVCRGRVFVEVLNRYSLAAAQRRRRKIDGVPLHDGSLLYSYLFVRKLIRDVLADAPIEWGSVIYFPLPWYLRAAAMEDRMPRKKNPFGLFMGISFPVYFTHMTLQDPLTGGRKLKVARKQVPGAVREVEK